jgi:hypothetical protein
VLALLTTARKATVAAVVAFISPPTALLLSDQDISPRALVASALLGVIGYLTTYETANTEPYEPRHSDRTGSTAAVQ